MTVKEEVRQIMVIPLDNIRAMQGGDRCKDVESLANSIKAIGLISPIVVRHGKGATYEIVAGHRRFAAAKAAGLDNIRAIVIEADDNLSEVVRMSENVHRLQMSPFEEAEAIAKLRRLKRTTEEIAADLGMRPQFVARRERLNHVIPEWAKRADAGKMSIAALEIIAMFEPSTQKQLLSKYQYWSPDAERLRDDLSQFMHRLKAAPWKLDDSMLLPAAGACNVCPKRSSSKPLLFHDEAEQKKIDAVDTCLEPSCWQKKREALFKSALKSAKATHPDLVFVKSGLYDRNPIGKGLVAENNLIERHKYEIAKKGDNKAKPAFVIDGDNAGKIIWITTSKPSTSPSRKNAKSVQPKGRTAEEDRQARRAKFIIDGIDKHIFNVPGVPAGLKAQSSDDKIKMLASLIENCSSGQKEDWPKIAKFKSMKIEDAVEILAERIFRDCDIPAHSFAAALEWIGAVRPFAETVLGMKWSEIEEQALEQIPDPKPKAGAAPKKKAGKK